MKFANGATITVTPESAHVYGVEFGNVGHVVSEDGGGSFRVVEFDVIPGKRQMVLVSHMIEVIGTATIIRS